MRVPNLEKIGTGELLLTRLLLATLSPRPKFAMTSIALWDMTMSDF